MPHPSSTRVANAWLNRTAGTHKGVKFYKMDSITAHKALNPHVGPWVFHSDGSAKGKLMRAYSALSERQKAALAFEAALAMSGATVVYRWLQGGDKPSQMGGASVTDDPTAFGYSPNVHSFRVTPDDVMLHYKQEDSWLSTKRFGHEHEMILKPNARPQHLGQVNTVAP